MTPTHPTSDEINAAINTAARRMTSMAPSGDLRARVMMKIDARQPRWGWRLAIAGGAIGAVALTTAGLWTARGVTNANTSIAQTASVTQGAANPTVAPIVSSPVLPMVSAKRTATRREIVAPSPSEMEWRARAVPALEQPDPLRVEPLEHSRTIIDPIDITPLSVAPLTVPAIGASSK